MNLRSIITTSALAIAGLGLWSYAGHQLNQSDRFTYEPNPLGLKRSPYGQVIAMAIQTPIDADWHGVIEARVGPTSGNEHDHGDHSDCSHGDCDGHHDHDLAKHGECDHEGCSHEEHQLAKVEPVAEEHHCTDPDCGHDHGASDTGTLSLIDRLGRIASKRTNPNPSTEGHKYYLRSEVEKKLKFAYSLDPSHYANFNSYHLFLTHSGLGTSSKSTAEGRKRADALADYTLKYCLREQTDPRPSLTAVSAAYNTLEAMLLDPENSYSTKQMREQLGMMDFSLSQHFNILQAATASGVWEQLSPFRQKEVLERGQFSLKLRESAEKAIILRETPLSSTANNESS